MKRNFMTLFTHGTVLALYAGCLALHALLRPIGWFLGRSKEKRDQRRAHEYRLLVIGTFYTRNWCISHLTPLSKAQNVHSITAIVDGPIQPIDKIVYVRPPRWLIRFAGRAVAKFCCALRCALRDPPDLVMGYYILPGALTAMLIARIVGARSGYQMTAGPVELLDGGAGTENFFLKNLVAPAPVLERLAFALTRRFDLVVVRGRRARSFLLDRNLAKEVRIIPGSIDTQRLSATSEPRCYDVVAVCRLVDIKQPEHMLQVLDRVRAQVPNLRAAIAGDGPLREDLRARADSLGLAKHIDFLGHVEDVELVLRQSKIFLLTSRSEGLSIAMAEAMAAGVVPVVAHVGDLGDLVRNGETGWLVTPGNFQEYADRIVALLSSPGALQDFSHAARAAAIEYNDVHRVAGRWARSFSQVCGWPQWVTEPWVIPNRRSSRARLPSRWQAWERIPSRWKRAVRGLVGYVPPQWCLGSRYSATQRLLEKAETWGHETVHAYQLHQLRRICELALERTRYYREAFRLAGFDPADLRSFEDFRRLPLIDKHTLRDNQEAMSAVPPGAAGIDRVSTGGTSGQPLYFHIGAERSGIEYAHLVAAWSRVGYHLPLPQAVLRGRMVAKEDAGIWHEFDPILRRHYYSTFHMNDDRMRSYLRHIETLGPCFLHVYPSSLDVLARFVERTGARVPRNVLGILAGSEIVYPENRTRAEVVFGARYFSWYGHSEKLVFAAECEHSTDYHVAPTYGYLELLDEDDRPVSTPGQRGEIVGTGFINTVVPFIRYRTGDYATYAGERCEACGRQQMLLRDIRGHRTQEMLVGKDGAMIFWTALNMHDDTFDHVHRFQFLQSEAGRATLRIIPAPGFTETDTRRILRNLGRKLAGNLELTVEVCSDIPLTRMGKATYVDQRIDLSKFLSGAKST